LGLGGYWRPDGRRGGGGGEVDASMKIAARIHITGASAAGVTTLGRAIAERLGAPQFDVDDFYWLPTDPPFVEKRPVAERLEMLAERLAGRSWILSGSLVGWGDPLIPLFDLVVFIYTPADVRLARLKVREAARYGRAIEPGGAMYQTSQAFLAWAMRYDDPHFEGRSLAVHNRWLGRLPTSPLRLDGLTPTAEQVELVITVLDEARDPARSIETR
jgi:adenylate kinase family enzyme